MFVVIKRRTPHAARVLGLPRPLAWKRVEIAPMRYPQEAQAQVERLNRGCGARPFAEYAIMEVQE